jgi:hypothetical protein
MNTGSERVFAAITYLCAVLPIGGQALAQAGPPQLTRSMATLMAEGYEIQDVRLFPDKIWMRKPDAAGGGIPYICDRGRLNSPSFEAYRNRRYDEISCSPVPP